MLSINEVFKNYSFKITVGVGDGREGQEGGDICILTADSRSCTQKPMRHCKAIIFQLKKAKKLFRDFPDSPVVQTSPSNVEGCGFNP